MTTTATAAPAQEITQLCTRHGIADFAPAFIQRNMSLPDVRSAVLEELARRDLAAGGHLNVSVGSTQPSAASREAIIDTLVYRMGGRPTGAVINSTDCVGLATRSLQMSGQRVLDSEGRDQIIRRGQPPGGDWAPRDTCGQYYTTPWTIPYPTIVHGLRPLIGYANEPPR